MRLAPQFDRAFQELVNAYGRGITTDGRSATPPDSAVEAVHELRDALQPRPPAQATPLPRRRAVRFCPTDRPLLQAAIAAAETLVGAPIHLRALKSAHGLRDFDRFGETADLFLHAVARDGRDVPEAIVASYGLELHDLQVAVSSTIDGLKRLNPDLEIRWRPKAAPLKASCNGGILETPKPDSLRSALCAFWATAHVAAGHLVQLSRSYPGFYLTGEGSGAPFDHERYHAFESEATMLGIGLLRECLARAGHPPKRSEALVRFLTDIARNDLEAFVDMFLKEDQRFTTQDPNLPRSDTPPVFSEFWRYDTRPYVEPEGVPRALRRRERAFVFTDTFTHSE
ncbi:MAG: hypothetical protein AAFX94_02535 [Myxococcota bacterium]